MTEPNVLGNVSGAKFIWENGNTEVINLWSADRFGGTKAMHSPSVGTTAGANYVVPVSRVFYLLYLDVNDNTNSVDFDIMKDTSPDVSTGTTVLKEENSTLHKEYNFGYIKFVAGEYINQVTTSGGSTDYVLCGWGVECDA